MSMVEYIRKKVAAIEDASGDPEAAHAMEDELYHQFVTLVAEGGDKVLQRGELVEIASEILKTRHLDFPRWGA